MKKVQGYKVFRPDFTCRGYQYEVGKTYVHEGDIGLCQAGFHFCKDLKDCFDYYSFDPKNKVAQVVALGKTIRGGDKCVTNKIEIIKELSWYEVLELVNTGNGNTGFGNSGDSNPGDENSGRGNSGNQNSGNFNSGNQNSGDFNSGNRNSGDFNSGSFNSGRANSGHFNLGHFNSGDKNSGDMNSGMFNACDYANGLFNSKSPKISMFNKPTKMTFEEFQEKYPEAYNLLCHSSFNLNEWVADSDMTEEEKKAYPEYKTIGGYLKRKDYKEACQEMWNRFDEADRNIIKDLPNFDKDIFEEITGIKIEE